MPRVQRQTRERPFPKSGLEGFDRLHPSFQNLCSALHCTIDRFLELLSVLFSLGPQRFLSLLHHFVHQGFHHPVSAAQEGCEEPAVDRLGLGLLCLAYGVPSTAVELAQAPCRGRSDGSSTMPGGVGSHQRSQYLAITSAFRGFAASHFQFERETLISTPRNSSPRDGQSDIGTASA